MYFFIVSVIIKHAVAAVVFTFVVNVVIVVVLLRILSFSLFPLILVALVSQAFTDCHLSWSPDLRDSNKRLTMQ